MKRLLSAGIVLFILATPSVLADELSVRSFLFGITPDSSVKEWIRLVYLGPRTSSPPIVWISPQRFPKEWPEVSIGLSAAQYRLFRAYSKANECKNTNTKAIISGLHVTEFSNKREAVLCAMSHTQACKYLKGIEKTPAFGWKYQKWEAVRILMRGVGCN